MAKDEPNKTRGGPTIPNAGVPVPGQPIDKYIDDYIDSYVKELECSLQAFLRDLQMLETKER